MLRKFELSLKPSKWSRNSHGHYIVFFENSIRNLVLVANSSSDSAARKYYERGKNLDDTIVHDVDRVNLKHNTVPAYTLVFSRYCCSMIRVLFVPRVTKRNNIFHVEDRSIPPAIAKSVFSIYEKHLFLLTYLLTYLQNNRYT